MGIDCYVKAIRSPDEKWQKMKAIYDLCIEQDIDVPDDVEYFFNGEEPDEKGIEVTMHAEEWSNEDYDGYEIKVSDIPKDVTIIRFYMG